MSITYASGEIIQKGDRVRYAGGSGIVSLSPIPKRRNPRMADFVDQPAGCMILTEKFGNIFLDAPQDDGALQFVARQKP